jgi:hypothetical protein
MFCRLGVSSIGGKRETKTQHLLVVSPGNLFGGLRLSPFDVDLPGGAEAIEGITHQPPKPPSRPRLPHQNFPDFSKSLENSKNIPDYREYSKYCEYRINFRICGLKVSKI